MCRVEFSKIGKHYRDVFTGATGATVVAPKFPDTLTLSPPGGGRFCPPLQRSQLNLPRGYVPDCHQSKDMYQNTFRSLFVYKL